MSSATPPTIDELIAETRLEADQLYACDAIYDHSIAEIRTLLVQLADALEETDKDATLIGRLQRRINNQMGAMQAFQSDLGAVYEANDVLRAERDSYKLRYESLQRTSEGTDIEIELAAVKESLDQANALRIENLDKGLDFARREIAAQQELADIRSQLCGAQDDLAAVSRDLSEVEAERDRYKAALEAIAATKVATAPTRKLDGCLKLARIALRPNEQSEVADATTTTNEPSIPDFLLPWNQEVRGETKTLLEQGLTDLEAGRISEFDDPEAQRDYCKTCQRVTAHWYTQNDGNTVCSVCDE